MKKRMAIATACLLVTFLSLKAFAAGLYPDLPPEYLDTFDAGSKYIVEWGEGADSVRVYDGETGRFLYAKDIGGLTDEQEILSCALADTANANIS